MTAAKRVLILALVAALVAGCASSPDERGGTPGADEELTVGMEILNVVSFPFRMIGYGLYYSFKFLFYDIWYGLYTLTFPPPEGDFEDSIPLLSDGDPQVRARAAEELGFSGSDEAADALVPLLEDSDTAVRAAAAGSLARLHSASTAGAVAAIFRSAKTPAVRAAAVKALSGAGGYESEEILALACGDEAWEVRAQAAVGIGRAGHKTKAAALSGMLDDGDPRVRGAAALGIAWLRDSSAIAKLRSMLDEAGKQGTFVRAAVITAIGEIGDVQSLPAIRAIAKGERDDACDEHSRSAAVLALGRIGSKEDAEFVERTLAKAQRPLEELESCAIALALLGREDALVSMAGSEETMTRAAAVKGLLEIGDERARAALWSMGNDAYSDVRQRVIVSLLVLGDERAVSLLLDQLKSPDVELRAWTYFELKRISGRDFGFETARWLEWWKDKAGSWKLRRYYPAPEKARRNG